jgi:hypothetical protein
MNPSFQRKVIYLVLIAALLVPLSIISRPATTAVGGSEGSAGGKLAQLRDQYKLGQAQLGKIDPTSSAVRYLSLGFHSLAACVLWNKADQYQRQEDWISLSAALTQITHLQPYYVKVWTFQSWNTAYNISAQWDDYRDKYYWVIRGFKLLHQGMEFNELEPQFPYELGWTISHKIGQADEKRDYRRLFAQDDDFHRLPWAQWVQERDNWLFGKRYLESAQDLVDRRGAVLRSLGSEMFNMQPCISQSFYAQTIEQEGTFGDKARRAWQQALSDWTKYGEREFPTDRGFPIRFNDLKPMQQRLDDVLKQLEAAAPARRSLIFLRKTAALSADERRALETDKDARTAAETRLAAVAALKVQVTDAEVAAEAEPAKADEAKRLASEATALREKVQQIKNSRHVFHYDYWIVRPEMEIADETLAARELFYRARAEADEKPWAARKTFEEGFALWRKILDKYPVMLDDQTSYDIFDLSREYRRVLAQLDEPFDPKKFILRDLLEGYEAVN